MDDIKVGSFVKMLPYEEIVENLRETEFPLFSKYEYIKLYEQNKLEVIWFRYDEEKNVTFVKVKGGNGNAFIHPLEVKVHSTYVVELI